MRIKLLLLLTATAILASCSSLSDREFFEGYDSAYSRQVSFTPHSVIRKQYNIAAREFSPENKGKLPTIILLHGFPDSLHLYDLLVPYIKAQRHVITFDFLGWGRSDKPENITYDTKSLYSDLDAVIKYFEVSNIELVAHDLSAFPVIDWALSNETRIHRLILLNSVYFPSENLVPPEAIARFSENSIYRDISAWVVNTFESRWQSGQEEQISKFFCNKNIANTFVKIFNYQSIPTRHAFLEMNRNLLAEVANRKTMIEKMRAFSRPVLVIFGAEDPYLNSKVAEEFHEIFPNSQLHLIKNACHYVQLDKPKEVAELILKNGKNR